MTQPKFFDLNKIKQDKENQFSHEKTKEMGASSVSEKNLRARIAELESQIKLITLDITKLENKKIKMDYFLKRDVIDKNGTIFDQMQHINPFLDNDEAKSLDRTLSSQYENNPEFQEAMQLVAREEKIQMRHKKPEDWTVEMRFKVRSILEQNYANFKISQDKYMRSFQAGANNLEGLKGDLKKETAKLKSLQATLKEIGTETKSPDLKQVGLRRS
ncbi:MAG: hypothetical protein P4M14_00535 [Gammaproteobacteria bacterium]|nr:hypothetical protein [Gammaproteobacteria bacterium]